MYFKEITENLAGNSNRSDRPKISASQMLLEERRVQNKYLSIYTGELLKIQDNLLVASAKELL